MRNDAIKAAGPKRVIAGKDRVTPNGTQKKPWIAPDDMEQWMVNLVRAGKMCGAHLARGGYCQSTPVSNQAAMGRPKPHRCKFHGGAVPIQFMTPAMLADVRARRTKFGPYSESIAPGEEELFLELARDSGLDKEITMTKLRLTRAVMAEHDALQHGSDEDSVRTDEIVETTSSGPDGFVRTVQKRKRHVNPSRTVHAIVLELTKLLQAKSLAAGSTDVGPQEAARLAREALAQARQRMTGGKPPKPKTEEKTDG